jgi:RNA polymerase sigma-70 factor, ECF subfamily
MLIKKNYICIENNITLTAINSISLYSDLRLVNMLKNGDRNAFEVIYNKYKSKLYYFAFRYIHSSAEAEEIIQNTFISLWEHRHLLDESLSIKNYLYKIVVNHVFNYLKHEAVRQKHIDYTLLHQTEDTKESVDDAIIYDDLKKNIDELIQYLPPMQRMIFKMSRIDGFSHLEIAKKLDISLRSVENHMYRALKFLKEKLNMLHHALIIIWMLSL